MGEVVHLLIVLTRSVWNVHISVTAATLGGSRRLVLMLKLPSDRWGWSVATQDWASLSGESLAADREVSASSSAGRGRHAKPLLCRTAMFMFV